MKAGPRQKVNTMTKKLNSLLEMAIVIAGLAAAPFAVVASLAPIATTVPHVTVAQNVAGPGLVTTGLRF
jgi:type IV secretory pathway component VirB8